MPKLLLTAITTVAFLFTSPEYAKAKANTLSIRAGKLELEFDSSLKSRLKSEGEGEFQSSEMLLLEDRGNATPIFKVNRKNFRRNKYGRQDLELVASTGTWEKTLHAWTEETFPEAIFLQTTYKNISTGKVKVYGWTSLKHDFPIHDSAAWAYLPSASSDRVNWLQPLQRGDAKENFLGMTATDYGGGTPLAALWTKQKGLAWGLAERTAKEIYLPIQYSQGKEPNLGITFKKESTVAPGQTVQTYVGFVSAFKGDAFIPLQSFATYMKAHGLPSPKPIKDQIGPIWCAWGYGRDFTVDQVIKTLPLAKKLGFEWVGIDDGWQEAVGDWNPNRRVFPNGEQDFKKFVAEIHKQGMKVQLWWAPMAAQRNSQYVRDHAEDLLLTTDGNPREITWWDSWYLCPAQNSVLAESERLTRKFLADWGVDGLKLDGQYLNASPTCANPAHHHHEDSAELHFQVQKKIFETAQSIRQSSLVEACPCGTTYSIFNLPYQNMTVGSDPLDAIQVRQKGKILRALTGDNTVYFGDHVELTRGDGDFASSVGLGALVGSNFSLAELGPPAPPPGDPETVLTPERKDHWAKWLAIAHAHPLWKGKYLGALYDIAFDLPETHAVLLGDNHYFAFYAESFQGEVEIRGLQANTEYRLQDYVNNISLGAVKGPKAKVAIKFQKNLLLVAIPAGKNF